MKKLLIILFLFIPIIALATLKTEIPNDDKYIYMYYKTQNAGKMTIEEFRQLKTSAENYVAELNSEREKRVKVHLNDDPWLMVINNKYETVARIVWYDKDNKELKSISVKMKMTPTTSNNELKWQTTYSKFAEISLPIAIALIAILILLLILLV